MRKAKKIILIILSIAVVLPIVAFLFIGALWSGAFDFMFPEEIATYNSPDGKYSLLFEQMGSPDWPFGSVDVRLTLKNQKGKKIKRISTYVHNDGASAREWNIKDISWNDDAVVVILQGAEMEDEKVSISYKKS